VGAADVGETQKEAFGAKEKTDYVYWQERDRNLKLGGNNANQGMKKGTTSLVLARRRAKSLLWIPNFTKLLSLGTPTRKGRRLPEK